MEEAAGGIAADIAGVTSAIEAIGKEINTAAHLGAGVPSFFVKTHDVAPSETSGMSASEVMSILHGLDVGSIEDAASAHKNLASQLDEVTKQLQNNASTLAGAWKGTAAQSAMSKFQQMHDQTAQLAAQAHQTSSVLSWTAKALSKFKSLPTPAGESLTQSDEAAGAAIGGKYGGVAGSAIGDTAGAIASVFGIGSNQQAKADAQAQKYLNALNQHLVAANNALPTTIGAQTVSATPGGTGLGAARGGGATSGGGGVVSGPGLNPYTGPTGTVSSAGPTGIAKFNPNPLPHGGGGSTGKLQGYQPPTTSPSPLPPNGPPTVGPTGPGNPPAPLPTPVTGPGQGPGPDPAPVNDGPVPPGDGPDGPLTGGNGAAGADGAIGGEGAAGDAAMQSGAMTGADAGIGANSGMAADSAMGASSAAGADGAANGEIGAADGSAMGGAEGEGMGMPMMGGASGQQDKERQRQAWMNEDEDIWGVPRDSIGAVIEGGR
jgi:hypothetical protein